MRLRRDADLSLKHVVSISLGSSKRNKSSCVTILGQKFKIERIGVDGDLGAFAAKFKELDGKVDALGVGGADIYLWIDKKRYTFRQIKRLTSGARITPVVDGSGLKHTLEYRLIHRLNESGEVRFYQERAFLTSAVDRFGMARALSEVCPHVVYGDLMLGVGLPIRLRSLTSIRILGSIALPIITRLPFRWFYPTGEKQDVRRPRFQWAFNEATVICGDWPFIRRSCPDKMERKVVITNTLRKADLEFLKVAGVSKAITSTPDIEGESFGTNVMEAVLVTILGKRPEDLTEDDYMRALSELDWQPNVFRLGV